jgi:hypothetical protein
MRPLPFLVIGLPTVHRAFGMSLLFENPAYLLSQRFNV